MTHSSPDRARDDAAIHAVGAAYDRAWDNGDIASLVACLAEDAVVVNPRGELARGRAEIMSALGEFLNGQAKGSKHKSVVSRVDFITEDVAIVDGVVRIEHLPPDDGTLVHCFTDVVVRRNGAWTIAHVRAYAATEMQTGEK
jgi:uncharacterized protein (TIGR02246 family)